MACFSYLCCIFNSCQTAQPGTWYRRCHDFANMGVFHGKTPIAGWFLGWKLPLIAGCSSIKMESSIFLPSPTLHAMGLPPLIFWFLRTAEISTITIHNIEAPVIVSCHKSTQSILNSQAKVIKFSPSDISPIFINSHFTFLVLHPTNR